MASGKCRCNKDVQLKGSKERKLSISADSAAQVNSGGGSETVTLLASAGYLANLRSFSFWVGGVSGATSGTHKVEIWLANIDASKILTISAAYNLPINIIHGRVVAGTPDSSSPTASADQLEITRDLPIDATNGLIIKYTNDTNANNSATRQYRAFGTEKAVVS